MRTRATNLKASLLCGALLLSVCGAARANDKATVGAPQGDYIEARSASVYAGPCHYSDEAVTGGTTAVLAWRFRGGAWNGVDVGGLSAVAVLSADKNLAEDMKTRRSALYLDARATTRQMEALRELFAQKFGAVLGRVVAVKAARTEVSNDGLDFRVRVGEEGEIARLDVNRYPCAHCTQDAQIWYRPFVEAQNVLVGKTTRTAFRDDALSAAWDNKQEANSAFVGTFAL